MVREWCKCGNRKLNVAGFLYPIKKLVMVVRFYLLNAQKFLSYIVRQLERVVKNFAEALNSLQMLFCFKFKFTVL